MVTVHRESGWKIAVYGREHGVPHFHIEGPEFRCSVSIETFDVIIGAAPVDVLKAACIWGRRNRVLLRAKWREFNG
jgi:hypothetical protein